MEVEGGGIIIIICYPSSIARRKKGARGRPGKQKKTEAELPATITSDWRGMIYIFLYFGVLLPTSKSQIACLPSLPQLSNTITSSPQVLHVAQRKLSLVVWSVFLLELWTTPTTARTSLDNLTPAATAFPPPPPPASHESIPDHRVFSSGRLVSYSSFIFVPLCTRHCSFFVAAASFIFFRASISHISVVCHFLQVVLVVAWLKRFLSPVPSRPPTSSFRQSL